jgi:hypothetical protein
MGRKRKRMMIMQRRSRLQEKLAATGQLKQEDNSVLIEKMAKMDEVVETTPVEDIPTETIEEMTDTIEMMVEELIQAEEKPMPKSMAKPMNLGKLRKTELLSMAATMNCNVTSKNTKRQIIAAIEKQST